MPDQDTIIQAIRLTDLRHPVKADFIVVFITHLGDLRQPANAIGSPIARLAHEDSKARNSLALTRANARRWFSLPIFSWNSAKVALAGLESWPRQCMNSLNTDAAKLAQDPRGVSMPHTAAILIGADIQPLVQSRFDASVSALRRQPLRGAQMFGFARQLVINTKAAGGTIPPWNKQLLDGLVLTEYI